MNINNDKVKNLSQQLSKKNILVLMVLIVSGTIVSCSPSQKESKPEQMQEQIQALKTISEPVIPATITPVQEIEQVEAVQTGEMSIEENSTNITSTPATNTTPPELNPPHGEPFHRCDIPVGSPLIAAASTTTTTANPNPTVQQSNFTPTIENAARLSNSSRNNATASTLANSTPPKLNPPHGQPFHRCDIAVGSPLPVN